MVRNFLMTTPAEYFFNLFDWNKKHISFEHVNVYNMMRYCQECFQLKTEWSSLKRGRCSLLMLTRELINRGQLYVIKSIEHSDLHWSRSSLLLALCCSLVHESKTSISIKKKKWKKTRRKNLSLSTSTSHSPRSPTRRFTWLDAALKTITIGLRKILPLYLDHLWVLF